MCTLDEVVQIIFTYVFTLIQPSLLRMYVEAYETLKSLIKVFLKNMRCFVMFVTAVCILFLYKSDLRTVIAKFAIFEQIRYFSIFKV